MVATTELTIFSKRYRRQILATLTAQILTFTHGIALGWLSPTLQLLQSFPSPVDFIITVTEAAWIGSCFGLGSLVGNVIFGVSLERLGRKGSIYLLALPHMLSWVLIYFAQNVEYLYLARCMAGVTGGGLYVVIPIFISEISDTNIRGALSSMTMSFVSFGLLVGFMLSTYLDYFIVPVIIVACPILYLLGNCFLPETPIYLLKRGRIEAAESSYNFYKNISKDNESLNVANGEKGPAVNNEFAALKTALLQSDAAVPVTLKDFFNKPTLRLLGTAFILTVLNQFSGSFAMINYMSSIFAQYGTTWLEPNNCTIIMGVVQMVGTFFATILVERYGRKPLLLTSASGMTLGMCSFGAFVQFSDAATKAHFNWLPLVFMALVIFTNAFGVFALTFTIIVEILPAKIRSQGQSICMIFISCLVFAALRLYPYLLHQLGISITLYICSSVCVSTSIYLFIFLPETKGKVMVRE